jgi:hypothetical protein
MFKIRIFKIKRCQELWANTAGQSYLRVTVAALAEKKKKTSSI